jgi:Uncharacterized conserved protein
MSKKYAVFIDGDNISSAYLDVIMTEIVKENDEILVKRIYGDWTTTNMNSWKEKLQDSPIRVFQQFRNGENATDNAIIMDAIELAIQNKDIDAYCIVSTDADYYSLALRLRENGKYVFGIGKENSKLIWQNSCNKFVKIENILKGEELAEDDNTTRIEKVMEKSNIDDEDIVNKKSITLGKAKVLPSVEGNSLNIIFEYGLANSKINTDGWISLADFGNTINARYPSFDPRTFGSKRLLPLVKLFEDNIEIKHDDWFPPNYYLRKKVFEE